MGDELMPYKWVEPEVFLEAPPGLSDVYHCYDEDFTMTWHYQIRTDRFDTGFTAFDIRDLAQVVDAGRKAGFTPGEHRSLLVLAMSAKPLAEWLGEIGYEGETE